MRAYEPSPLLAGSRVGLAALFGMIVALANETDVPCLRVPGPETDPSREKTRDRDSITRQRFLVLRAIILSTPTLSPTTTTTKPSAQARASLEGT